MILTIKLDWNWSSFQLANSAPPLGVTDSAIAPSARMPRVQRLVQQSQVTFSEQGPQSGTYVLQCGTAELMNLGFSYQMNGNSKRLKRSDLSS